MKNKGYLLPPELEPESDRCFVVYVPDTEEYILAFFGSLSGLEKWNIWERTGDNSGALAAARWKLANERTFIANEILDCQLLNDLLEDGDMSINITNNISCGTCGQSHSGPCEPVILYPPEFPQEFAESVEPMPEQQDPGGDLFPNGFDSREEYEFHKCVAARNLASDIRDTLFNMSRLSGIAAAAGVILFTALINAPASGIISVLLAPLVLTVGTPAAIAIVGSILLLLVIGGGITMLTYFGVLGTELDLDDLTCRLYCSNSIAEAKQAVIDIVGETIGEIVFADATEENLFTANVPVLVSALIPNPLFKFLFAANAVVDAAMEGRFDGFDCSACGCDEETELAGYNIVDAMLTCPDPLPGNQTCDINGNTLTTTFATNDGSQAAHLAAVAHGETEWHAVVYEPIWDVGTWRQSRFGAQNAGLTWVSGGVYVVAAGNLGSTARANVEAWAVENGYTYHHDVDIAPTSQASMDHVARLDHPTGQVSQLVMRYRFLIPA